MRRSDWEDALTSSNLSRRSFIACTAAAGGILTAPGIVRAQSYPSRTVTIVCGFSAGGTTDALARLLAAELSENLGQPFVVENRTGAAGAIGMTAAARARPDGLTLLFSAVGQLAVVPHTSNSLTIDPRSDLRHISMLAEGDFILTANSQVPAANIEEFIAMAKARPNELFYGTSGAGGNLHLFVEAFNLAAGIQMRGVHYSGGATLMPDVLSNQVQVALNSYPVAAPYVAESQLKPLLVVGKERNANLPDVPIGPDIGLDDLARCMDWFGLHAPAGTPDEIVAVLADATAKAAKSPAMADRLKASSLRTVASSPQDFEARIREDYDLFGQIAERAGMKTA
ncbi:Bug family tripartite tricarboxylate transporter substrate binding protein [Falsirhodobacter xinxiangensis]|uniref:Bug family tripartite tricarboxylate transporter substrate binding protein n=1 Tax=Falsirhodobacter xinxiangensis TaxID=2530049 RepID=UPI00145AAEF1|nr:tripartite tricarboxylate transporter substrate binding protein [Rhodobacter xinxiangensis]